MNRLYCHILILLLPFVLPGFTVQSIADNAHGSAQMPRSMQVFYQKPAAQSDLYTHNDITPLPNDENRFPSIPACISASYLARVDAALKEQFQDGINYDPISHSWWFEGIPTEKVRYDIRGGGIDLVRVRFLADGQPRAVWVAAGIQLVTGEYYTWGPWDNESEVFEGLQLGCTGIRVVIGESMGPYVDADGVVDFSKCDSPLCRYADWSETSSNYLSHRFITSNGSMAPGWYPWGYLVWRVIPQEKASSCFQSPNSTVGARFH